MNKLTILLLLANSIAFHVYSQTMSLDTTFGQNGRTIITKTTELRFFDFDNHGNIIAAGYTLKGGGKYDLTITKTNADGIIDESFGSGGVSKVTNYDNSSPHGLKITNDNKIVVIGDFTEVQYQGRETLIMRFNENGTVDENYGDNGKVNLNYPGNLISLNCESDKFMLLGIREGYTVENNGNLYYTLTGYSISKYDYDGNLDENFGDNGKAYLPNYLLPYSIKILSDSSIAIAGTYNQFPDTELGFCKLTAVGELDTNFANDGVWHMNIMQDFDLAHEFFSSILEDSNGNLILSGSGLTNSLGQSNRAFLSKFSNNGILKTEFGENGFYCFDFSGIYNTTIQIKDKYVTAGWYNNESNKIIYVNSDGSFGDYIYTCDHDYFKDMKLQVGWNKIILGGADKSNNANSAEFALERVNFDFEAPIQSIHDNSNGAMIFPNPAKEGLYFDNKTSFEIIDFQGKILLKSETPIKSVNIGNLGSGIYFVRFGNRVQKLVKK